MTLKNKKLEKANDIAEILQIDELDRKCSGNHPKMWCIWEKLLAVVEYFDKENMDKQTSKPEKGYIRLKEDIHCDAEKGGGGNIFRKGQVLAVDQYDYYTCYIVTSFGDRYLVKEDDFKYIEFVDIKIMTSGSKE